MEWVNDVGYTWALQEIKTSFQPPRIPKIIIKDSEPAMKLAIELVFPSSMHNYFTWHIRKTLIPNCHKCFQEDDWRYYQLSWSLLVSSKSTDEYDKNLEKIKVKSNDYLVHGHISQTTYSYSRKYFSLLGKARILTLEFKAALVLNLHTPTPGRILCQSSAIDFTSRKHQAG
ncbi:hypothetical protein O181_113367 [Austropuccinia psidii MF-1]|uniref:MULE transposase domain-containing protein n=1 Tax=Austropuccinia psidii MF-1 TaxID=1389203 RepID=A0A9Q3PVA0_9BASI|nr:hypothetical protein [Austropuccinia psidii MF-1]